MNKLTKRALLSAVMVTIVTLLAFTACNSDREDGLTETVSTASHSQLLSELQEFNGTLPAAPDKISLRTLDHILDVAWADAEGMGLGITIGGAIGTVIEPGLGSAIGLAIGGRLFADAASARAIIKKFLFFSAELNTESSVLYMPKKESFEACYAFVKNKIQSSDYNLGLSLGLDSCYIQSGIIHNLILDNVYEIELSGNQGSLKDNGLTAIEKRVLDSEEYIAAYEEVAKNGAQGAFSGNTKRDEVLKLFIQSVKEKCNDEKDLTEILRKYISTVCDSKELSVDDKNYLCNVFAVMAYSFDYWNQNWEDFISKAKSFRSTTTI